MENFSKINGLFKELYDEFITLKNDLENDVNYSPSHPELIHMVEMAEESLQDVETQISAIKDEWDAIDNVAESRSFQDDDDGDDREERYFNPSADED